MEDIETLRQELREASQALGRLKYERDEFEQKERGQFYRELSAKLEERFGASLREAQEKESEVLARFQAAQEREALAAEYTYPLGTVMAEWDHYPRYSRTRRFTGRRGVLEVITSESVHPSNLGFTAHPGDVVIRLLNKNGTPGKAYVKGWKVTSVWVPEGTDLSAPDLSWTLKKEPQSIEVGEAIDAEWEES